MIAPLTEEIRAQLGQYQRLQLANVAAGNLRDAGRVLREIRQAAEALSRQYSLLTSRLDETEAKDLQRRAVRAQLQLRDLAAEVGGGQRQVRPLETVRDSLRDLKTDLELRWRARANAQLGPQLQLLTLLRQFADLSAQASGLAQLQSELRAAQERVPTTAADLAAYDKVLRKVDDRVRALQADLPDVAFLQLVATGRATLADVDERTLKWCHEGERGRMFRISFAAPGETRQP